MRYLGGIFGCGLLKCNNEEIARATYGFDGCLKKSVGVTTCGEIRATAIALKDVFGRKNVQLLIDYGRFRDPCFSEMILLVSSAAALWVSRGNCRPLSEIGATRLRR